MIISIDPRFLQPLPKSLWNVACACCSRTISKWALHEPMGGAAGPPQPASDFMALCSLCFLYKSEWGKRLAEGISQLISDVEKEARIKFDKDSEGRLNLPKDADRVLSAVALASRVQDLMDKGNS